MDRNLVLEVVRVTEAAAIAAARLAGRGDAKGADQVAVEAMRRAFESVAIAGTVVIGEGERDEAPMLFIGEKVGRRHAGDPELEIAVDPLEGTALCATGAANALAVVAMGEPGRLLHAPDSYMQKIAVGPGAKGVIDLDASVNVNLHRIADALRKDVADLTVTVQERPRHEALVKAIRETGARVRLFQEGDVSAAIATGLPGSGVDVLMGTGGAPEGVLAAAALRCVDGDLQGRLVFRSETERARAVAMGHAEPERKLGIQDLAGGDVVFAATGVTGGEFLSGVRFGHAAVHTRSIVMRSRTGTIRWIDTLHRMPGPDAGW
ncbi:MAG: class II fructose-bisphosphatase [Anaeromyxobacteraceae bacterium]